MRVEEQCVLALARGDTLLPFSLREIDGDRFSELACRHGVAALGYWRLTQDPLLAIAWAELPARAVKRLQIAYVYYAARSDRLAAQLEDLQEGLDARGIDAIVFKGPWLAFGAYPVPGTRPIADIDLGVRERDYERACTALHGLGYRSTRELPISAMSALRRAHFGEQLRFSAPRRLPVELHFRMINIGPPALSEDWLWRGKRALDVKGSVISVPGPEAMLLHLLVHANQHGFAKLRLLYDIHFALRGLSDEFDTGQFLALVRNLQCQACAYFGLVLARDLTKADVPTELLKHLRPSRIRRALYSRLWALRSSYALETTRRRVEFESPRFYLLEMGRVSQKAAYLRGIVQEAGGAVGMLKRVAHLRLAGSD